MHTPRPVGGSSAAFAYHRPTLNIALVILHTEPAKGGAETYTVDLARALADRGYAVSMLAASFADAVDPRVRRGPAPPPGASPVGPDMSLPCGAAPPRSRRAPGATPGAPPGRRGEP